MISSYYQECIKKNLFNTQKHSLVIPMTTALSSCNMISTNILNLEDLRLTTLNTTNSLKTLPKVTDVLNQSSQSINHDLLNMKVALFSDMA